MPDMRNSPYHAVTGSPDLLANPDALPGGLGHLVQYLWDGYAAQLRRDVTARVQAGLPTVSLDEAKARAPATAFAK